MPYAIKKQRGKWVVVNKENGHVKGEHPTREKALAQLRALYANVPDARKKGGKKK